MTLFVMLIVGSCASAAVPGITATVTGVPAAAPAVTATLTGAAVISATSSAVSAKSPEGWSESELTWLRCKHIAHARERDGGWSFEQWMNPARCPGDFWTGPARDAWDRYLKRSRPFDECIRDRRTRKPRAFMMGSAVGFLVTAAMMGITQQGSDTTILAAATGVGLTTGSLWWWRERGKPDPVCRTEPATEWLR